MRRGTSLRRLHDVFCEAFGGDAVVRRKLLPSTAQHQAAVICLGGDQLTGKSTLGQNLARHYGGSFWSVGAAFRELAASRGLRVEELSALLKREAAAATTNTTVPSVDMEIDFRTAQHVARRTDDDDDDDDDEQRSNAVLVVEGRQPALMSRYIEYLLGADAAVLPHVRLYLQCSVRERALRYLKRRAALSDADAERLDATWPHAPRDSDEAAQARHYATLLAAVASDDDLAARFIEEQRRDADDVDRYMSLYGVDYRAADIYDTRLDTSGRTASDNFARSLDAVRNVATQRSIEDLL